MRQGGRKERKARHAMLSCGHGGAGRREGCRSAGVEHAHVPRRTEPATHPDEHAPAGLCSGLCSGLWLCVREAPAQQRALDSTVALHSKVFRLCKRQTPPLRTPHLEEPVPGGLARVVQQPQPLQPALPVVLQVSKKGQPPLKPGQRRPQRALLAQPHLQAEGRGRKERGGKQGRVDSRRAGAHGPEARQGSCVSGVWQAGRQTAKAGRQAGKPPRQAGRQANHQGRQTTKAGRQAPPHQAARLPAPPRSRARPPLGARPPGPGSAAWPAPPRPPAAPWGTPAGLRRSRRPGPRTPRARCPR